MKKWIVLFMILLLGGFIIGCGPTKVDPFKPKPISFNKTEEYKVNLDKVEKPDPIQPIYVKEKEGSIKKVPKENATMVLLPQQEYKKVSALLEVAHGYKKIAKKQEDLVNLKIDEINSLKEYIALERKKSNQYREMWINSENKYREEKWNHEWDNKINKIGTYIITIGSIAGIIAVGF